MILRRNFLKGLIFGGAVMFSGAVALADAEMLDAQTLKFKLEAKGKIEETFIDTVVAMRDKKIIPEKYVYSAYQYAMKKNKNRFTYFAKAITHLCEQDKIKIPVPYEQKRQYF